MGANVYESRWLLYVDILGWRDQIASGFDSKLLSVLERIHLIAETHNERACRDFLARDGKREEWTPGVQGTFKINPLFLQTQFAAFSDHFVLSMHDSYGAWFTKTFAHLP